MATPKKKQPVPHPSVRAGRKAPVRRVKPVAAAPEEAPKGRYVFAVGRRKSAVALIRVFPEKGPFSVNGKSLVEFAPDRTMRGIIEAPFSELKMEPLKVHVKVRGGGIKGQAEAVRLGLSRALVLVNPANRPRLKTLGFLTRDARVKERRKYGLKKARRAPQWAKR